MTECRIILVDGHAGFRCAMGKVLEARDVFEVVGEAADEQELCELMADCAPDVVIMEMPRSRLGAAQVIQNVKRLRAGVKVLTLTPAADKAYLFHSIEAGADGCLLKEHIDTELCHAVATVQKGDLYLSPAFCSSPPDGA